MKGNFQYFTVFRAQSVESFFQNIPDGMVAVNLVMQCPFTGILESLAANTFGKTKDAKTRFVSLLRVWFGFQYLPDVRLG